jgi:tRNA-modifying protein YgfZ
MPQTEVQLHGIVDRSERGKLALTGAEAKVFLNGQVTNDVEALTAGHGLYAAFLTHKGKMLGDLRVLDLGPPTHELWLDTERAALQPLFDTIRRAKIGFDVELHKRTLQQGLISIVGDAPVDPGPDEHDNARAKVAGIPVLAVRTHLGVDLVCDAERTDELKRALGLPEIDAEVPRVEAGRPRYGVDLDETVIPQEAGLNDRAVSFTKGCYVGQETVARLYYKGKPNRHLRGLRLSAPVATGTALRLGAKEVGRVGSVVDSPRFGPIALAIVRREAAPGDELEAGDATATVVELPF